MYHCGIFKAEFWTSIYRHTTCTFPGKRYTLKVPDGDPKCQAKKPVKFTTFISKSVLYLFMCVLISRLDTVEEPEVR